MHTALVIEADPALRRSLLRILGRHGWQVDAPQCVERAMVLLEQKPWDIALISLQLPEKSGLWLLAKIKERPDWRATATVVTHGSATSEEIDRAVEREVDSQLGSAHRASICPEQVTGISMSSLAISNNRINVPAPP